MVIPIRYGTRPSEKLIEKGNFICPLCCRKRPYKRFRVAKESFFGVITLSSETFGEYVQCQNCLRPFPPKVLDPSAQLTIKIDNGLLPSPDILDTWQKAYITLNCEDLIAKKSGVVEVISPILLTIASHMQVVGVKLRLQEFEEARKYLVTIINFCLEWHATSLKFDQQPQNSDSERHTRKSWNI